MTSQPQQHVSPFEFTHGLKAKAFGRAASMVINAGRGNPNFLLTDVRDAFALLLYFATHCATAATPIPAKSAEGGECERYPVGLRVRPQVQGIASKLKSWLEEHSQSKGAEFLAKAVDYIQDEVDEDVDRVVFELVDAAQGDFYPEPPRLLPVVKPIIRRYLSKVLFSNNSPTEGTKSKPIKQIGRWSLFATEGATAAMIYVFHSLRINKVLRSGDRVAIVTPIFSPYLEIPVLQENGLVPVFLELTEESGYSSIPKSEIAKLRDPAIKALFEVNPGNPGSSSLDRETVTELARTIGEHNPGLVVISDAVYATFSQEFHSLIREIPQNVIGVYSFSKYFGVTGWRLGVVMVHDTCVVDSLIRALPRGDGDELAKRYAIIAKHKMRYTERSSECDERHISFARRLVADSRALALAHTAGLSTPQQTIMALFALYELLDKRGCYRHSVHHLLRTRWERLFAGLGVPAPDGPLLTRYYALVNVITLAELPPRSKEFAEWFVRSMTIESFLERLAFEYITIVLPGKGFQASPWTIRISVANIGLDECGIVGQNIIKLLNDIHQEWTVSKKSTPAVHQHQRTDGGAPSTVPIIKSP